MMDAADVGSTMQRPVFKLKELDLSKLRASQPIAKLDRNAMDQCQNCKSQPGRYSSQSSLDRNMIMLSCGDILCVKCVDSHMKESLLKKGSDLWCPVCLESTHIPDKLRLKVEEIKEKARQQSFIIYCDTHPDLEARFYCQVHKHMTCEACA